MKKSAYHVTVVLTAIALLMPASTIFADDEGDWKDMKQESKKMKLDETAEEALQALFAANPKAKELYEGSYGWAVFDNLKLAFGFSGGGGNGVAVAKENDKRTYMKMGTAGIGFGLGANKYQVIFLFQDSQTFDNFVNNGWQADAARHRVGRYKCRRGQDRLRQRYRHLPDDRKGPDGECRHRRDQVLEERQAQLDLGQENIVKKTAVFAIALAAIVVGWPTTTSFGSEDSWKSLKRESKRMKIDEMAQESLNSLLADRRQGQAALRQLVRLGGL